MARKKDDAGGYAIGGGLMLGIGVGFFFLQQSALAFVGCIIGGLGIGLIIAAFFNFRRSGSSRE